jgi:hypothetical protein
MNDTQLITFSIVLVLIQGCFAYMHFKYLQKRDQEEEKKYQEFLANRKKQGKYK